MIERRRCGRGIATALCIASVALTGCGGGLLTSDADTPETYTLQSMRHAADPATAVSSGAAVPAAPAALPLVLIVARPRAAATLDTDRIAIVPGGNRFDYYANARWSESAPQLVQHAMVDALTADGRFAAALAAPARVPAELLLDLELRRFEAVAAGAGSAPVVHVQLQANLVDSRSSVRVASFLSEASAPAAANRLSAVIDAFAQASATVITDVVTRVSAAAAPAPRQ